MNTVLKIFEQVAMESLLKSKPSVGGFVRKGKIMTPFLAVSGLMVVMAFVFAQYAVFLWLKSLFEPQIAALITAGLALFIALFSVSIGYMALSIHRRKMEKKQNEMSDIVKTTLDILQKEVNDNVQSNPKMSVLTAALAGYAAGNYK